VLLRRCGPDPAAASPRLLLRPCPGPWAAPVVFQADMALDRLLSILSIVSLSSLVVPAAAAIEGVGDSCSMVWSFVAPSCTSISLSITIRGAAVAGGERRPPPPAEDAMPAC